CVDDVCVECRADGDCDGGLCDAGVCVECRESADCAEGFCVESACVECQESADCGQGFCVENACVDCREDADCGGGLSCLIGRCVEAMPAGTCAAPTVLALGIPAVGVTEGAAAVLAASCGNMAPGPEAVYVLTLDAAGPVCVDTLGSTYDTVLSVRAAPCADGEERACNDDFIGSVSRVEFEAAAATPYYVIVDAYNADGGIYSVRATAGACGPL
ncbi:MAG: hypothetical protein H6705_21480, partial [Myxococcales bacterium]|nr:hypothetical protein [Myxococcales bacterium]